ncbi:ferritin-like domain-containing protein [Candidatus Woesearchaeota archaeon]|nr:ferritin-like domain-containing protein [Candidatus Woesearchaeota archaeon]
MTVHEVKLWRCKICGDPYIGNNPPDQCPFCGAHKNFIVEAKDFSETWDVKLNEKDLANAKHALEVEISNAQFYFCASKKTDDDEGKQLFKALGKVEAEHAAVWKKILKLDKIEIPEYNKCFPSNRDNLEESHMREERAIKFYRQAAQESESPRMKQIFGALVQVETDHLKLSEERLK